MADKHYPVHYANFVCHFGADELLNYLHEIVVPAFTSSHVRTFKDGRYFFNSVAILDLSAKEDGSELAICGRFVKDMIVRSEQRWDPSIGSLVAEIRKMETAPSAIFVLLLASHKLIYLLETSNAPGMESFRSTAANFLAAERRKYISSVAERAKEGRLTAKETERFVENDETGAQVKITKTRLAELVGAVDLEVVPLSNEESLRKFLERFKVLQAASLRLVKPNSELDNDDFIDEFRTKADAVGSKNSSLNYRNPDGLIKSQIAGQLDAAAADANTEIKLEGKDAAGQVLRGSNHEFKIVSYLDSKVTDLATTARRMFALFKSQRETGLIKMTGSAPTDEAKAALTVLASQMRDPQDGRA